MKLQRIVHGILMSFTQNSKVVSSKKLINFDQFAVSRAEKLKGGDDGHGSFVDIYVVKI